MTDIINIKIIDGQGREVKISVKNSDSISTAKEKAKSKGYRWRYNGEILKDDKTLEYYGIEDGDAIIKGEQVIGGKTQ